MGIRHLIRATALITLTLQVAMTALGAISLCVAIRHTHAGAPAADCPMHHRPPPAATAAIHHQHHGGSHHGASPDAGRVECRCSSETLSFAAGAVGVVADRVGVEAPAPTLTAMAAFTPTTLDLHIPPLSPPPRPSIF